MDFSLCEKIIENIGRVMVGKTRPTELLLVTLLAEGHVLIEDVPGVAKTMLAKCLAKSIGGSFNRVQFTPDLMPTDITGFNVYDQRSAQFSFRSGPVITMCCWPMKSTAPSRAPSPACWNAWKNVR